jgi:hypothetical protein
MLALHKRFITFGLIGALDFSWLQGVKFSLNYDEALGVGVRERGKIVLLHYDSDTFAPSGAVLASLN